MTFRSFACCLLTCLVATAALAQAPRLRVTLNDGWRYADGPHPGAEDPTYADSAWTSVDLPHTWNAEDAFDKVPGYRRGVGWYRRTLALDPELEGQRIYLYFEGANQVADVYVNGDSVGQHVGGYTAFAFDVTDQVRFDGPNLVAVRVDNSHDPDIPPLDADFTFYGGIYRDVWLVATPPLHVADPVDLAAPGLYLDTPEASAERATVRVRGTLLNYGPTRRLRLVHRLLDADDQVAATIEHTLTARRGQTTAFEEQTRLDAPRLWWPDDPHVYRVETEVQDRRGTLIDRVVQPLGVRWFEADAQAGFFLNGERLPLYGTNRHQDYPVLGNALPDALHRADVEYVKDTGFNFLRLAHYPQDPAVLEATDRLGLVVWEEIPVVNTITMSEAFAENAERRLVEMVRQHYNHPSVVMWGYMNEILLREPRPLPEGYRAATLALAERLEARLKEEDPIRLSAMAISQGEIDNGSGLQDVTDVIGFNLYFGWYGGTFEGFGPFLDAFHTEHPDRPVFISEYGAGSDERVHTADGQRFDFSSGYQQAFHRSHFAQIRARSYLIGSAVWNQFDFGSAGRQDTKNAINQKGLYFFDRTPKDIVHYYRAVLLDEPVLHLADEWHQRAGTGAAGAQPVWAYTNLPSVDLYVNGAAAGVQTPRNGTAAWEVALRPGRNHLMVVGATEDGRAVRDEAAITYADGAPAGMGVGDALAVNVGASYAYVDAAGTVWQADRAYDSAAGWGHLGGQARRVHHRITRTDDDPLYQAVRDSVAGYRFDMPAGTYEVLLGFADVDQDSAGARVFDVVANDQRVRPGLDLAAAAGRWAALRLTTRVAVADDGLRLTFPATAGTPMLAAIHLRRME